MWNVFSLFLGLISNGVARFPFNLHHGYTRANFGKEEKGGRTFGGKTNKLQPLVGMEEKLLTLIFVRATKTPVHAYEGGKGAEEKTSYHDCTLCSALEKELRSHRLPPTA